ncbi:TPA: hypothetical protein I9259_000924 [Legionella pneumophila]|nr:hypothetical protein [Legionella pneumophila]HAT6831966.1 hypothetical protein [Legionella pneumophila]
MSRSKFFKSNRTHVIELYCYSNEYAEQVNHEITSGADSGPLLTKIYGQDVRFIYAPDSEKFNLVLNEARKRNYNQPIINLYEPDNIKYLLSRLSHGDSILINGQGDIHKQLIAGRNAEELVDILENDLELKELSLKNLDIDSCRMGRVESYRHELKHHLKNFQTVTTYTDLCTASQRGGVPYRMWIEERADRDVFYTESDLNKKGTRIIEYTDTYKNSLKEIWKTNPYNLEEIDLSDHIDILVIASC